MMDTGNKEAGFSYVDVMMAVTILLIGVMALVSAITSAIVMTTGSQQATFAKQIALSTLESIYSARDVDRFQWGAVGNVGSASVPGGIFVAGEQQIWPTAGADGIIGTADDQAGPDGTLGNADDGAPEPGFTRQIVITDIPDPARPGAPITLRQLQVTVFYNVGQVRRQQTVTSFIAEYRDTVD